MGACPISEARWAKFLAAIEHGLDIHRACRVSGVGYVVQWKERKRNPEFAKRFDEAYDLGRAAVLSIMEAEADRRGIKGTTKPVYQGGRRVGSVQEYSDSLLMFRMKKLDPSYRDKTAPEINNSGGGAIHVHITQSDADL